MAAINGARVFSGGVAAGAVMAVVDYATNNFWLQHDWVQFAQDHYVDVQAAATTAAFVKFCLIDLVFGLIAVFTYAAMRPRYGPGPKTAAIAGVTLFLFSAFTMLSLQVGGLFEIGFYLKGTAASALSIIPGTIVGAWLYKEEKSVFE